MEQDPKESKNCSFTVLMEKKDRNAFKLAVIAQGKTVRQVLPLLIKQWTKENSRGRK